MVVLPCDFISLWQVTVEPIKSLAVDDSVKFLTNVEAGHPGYFIVVSVGDENEVHGRFIESRKIVFIICLGHFLVFLSMVSACW